MNTREDGGNSVRQALIRWALVSALVLAFLGVSYVLSYAPYLRYVHGDDRHLPSGGGRWTYDERTFDGHHLPYRPVEALIDRSPTAARALGAWAELWKVRKQHEWRAEMRSLDRGVQNLLE